MPITLDLKTYDYVLESDREKPKDKQPAFICKVLSTKKWRELARINDNLDDIDGLDKQLGQMIDIIMIGVSDWRNMVNGQGPIEFNQENLEDILTFGEVAELMQCVVHNGITIDDKKKLEPQSPSDTGPSANPAPEQADAKTNQTKPNGQN